MKKTLLIIIFLSFFSASFAQTYIKFNALYWALGVTNASVETRVGEHFTFNNDIVISPWKSIKNNPMVIGQFIPELRYYPVHAFKGFYAGAYAGAHAFRMSKWNYINTGKYQKGWGFSAGASIGYEVPINDRWLLDVYGAAGWQISRYRGFYKSDRKKYIGLNNSGEWLPYKVGISFAYKIGGR
ncbi:MAG: DUF3575 domain-containing protein [Alistipes sp.]|nr:DUF3575 domain-containing protein [Alistipes sp.]